MGAFLKIKKNYPAIIWVLLFGIFTFLSFNMHSRSGLYNYHSEIWADKAGYYVYLPAAFIYHFDGSLMPDSIVDKTGNGFQVDPIFYKIKTKYTYVTALLQAPFFLLAHALAYTFEFERTGFSGVYQKFINVAAVFYFVLGLFLSYKVLRKYFSTQICILTLGFLVLGTNLFYYVVNETGMSHVYSFFLFSLLLYVIKTYFPVNGNKIISGFALGLLVALIVLTRPTNIIFVLAAFFFIPDWRKSLKDFFSIQFILPFILSVIIVFLPQLIYWNYLSGSFIHYSYGNESFSSWNHPKIIATLFAPHNGHFLYNPIFILILFGLGLMIIKKEVKGWVVFMVFLLLTYLTASWYDFTFGCGYAGRNYVEYYMLFSIPLAFLLAELKNIYLKLSVYFLMGIFSAYNLTMIYAYDECWFGEGIWDWDEYFRLLNSAF